MRHEFDDVFQSLFEHHEQHQAIIRALARRRSGLTRDALIAALKIHSGGSLNRRLVELEEAGFIARVEPFAARVKHTLFRIVDECSLFYLEWVESGSKGLPARGGSSYWKERARTTNHLTWRDTPSKRCV